MAILKMCNNTTFAKCHSNFILQNTLLNMHYLLCKINTSKTIATFIYYLNVYLRCVMSLLRSQPFILLSLCAPLIPHSPFPSTHLSKYTTQ